MYTGTESTGIRYKIEYEVAFSFAEAATSIILKSIMWLDTLQVDLSISFESTVFSAIFDSNFCKEFWTFIVVINTVLIILQIHVQIDGKYINLTFQNSTFIRKF